MDDRISKILQYLEKDIEAGNLVDKLPDHVEKFMASRNLSNVDVNEVIEGDVEIGSLEEAEDWIDKHREG